MVHTSYYSYMRRAKRAATKATEERMTVVAEGRGEGRVLLSLFSRFHTFLFAVVDAIV